MSAFKLVARDKHEPGPTVVEVGSVGIGGRLAVLAGWTGDAPGERILEAAQALKETGARILRWPKIDLSDEDAPSSRQAAGRFDLIRETRRLTGLPVIVEVSDTREVGEAAAAADALLIGPGHMQNFSLLKEVGRSALKPVVLARGRHATIDEWLNSAEYVLSEGNLRVILCEGGIRSSVAGSPPVLDISSVAAAVNITHLPIIVDLSRAGWPDTVERMALASVAAGAEGFLVNVALAAPDPGSAEGSAGLSMGALKELVEKATFLRSLTEGLKDDNP